MPNLTRQTLIEEIDWERRESNAKFISPEQTVRLLNRAVRRILREPGIRTLPELQLISLQKNVSRYSVREDFKEVISLWSGEGSPTGIEFTYKPVDEFNQVVVGFHYTFIEPGFIEIKFPDIDTLSDSVLKHRFWSRNIVTDSTGTAKKTTWDDNEDKSRLPEDFDEFYIEWVVSRILRREGKDEWKERHQLAMEVLAHLKESPGSKSRRPKRAFGHYMRGN